MIFRQVKNTQRSHCLAYCRLVHPIPEPASGAAAGAAAQPVRRVCCYRILVAQAPRLRTIPSFADRLQPGALRSRLRFRVKVTGREGNAFHPRKKSFEVRYVCAMAERSCGVDSAYQDRPDIMKLSPVLSNVLYPQMTLMLSSSACCNHLSEFRPVPYRKLLTARRATTTTAASSGLCTASPSGCCSRT